MKAQGPCLMRAKNIMPLSCGPSVYATLDVCSILLFSIRTYSALTVVDDYHDSAYNACCTIHCLNLPASDWAAENADPNHRGIFSQIIMQAHCLYLFIMRRYFWNLFRNCGSQNTPSICSKIFKKISATCLHQRRGPTAKNKRWKTTSLSSRWAVTSTSFSLGFSNQ